MNLERRTGECIAISYAEDYKNHCPEERLLIFLCGHEREAQCNLRLRELHHILITDGGARRVTVIFYSDVSKSVAHGLGGWTGDDRLVGSLLRTEEG